jgi:hypothetical protein
VQIQNTISEYSDVSISDTGKRLELDRRIIAMTGRLYVNTDDSDFHIQELFKATAPTADAGFQIGAVAASSPDVANGALFAVNNVQPASMKYDKTGSALVVELGGSKATGTTGGDEFALTFN